jgi:hypothetical protein
MNNYMMMHSFMNPNYVAPFGLPNNVFFAGLAVIAVWTLIWKGLALWHAARNNQKIWFVVLIIVNTIGILEILYLAFGRKNKNDVVHTTTVTHTVTASTPAPDMASSVPPTPIV